MDDGEVLNRCGRNGNARDAFGGRRERGEKRERKMADGVAKFRTVRPVPGIDGVEGFELRDASPVHDSHQTQGSVGKSPCAIGETEQGQYRPRGPDFGIKGAGCFEGGEREDHVSDGAWPD
jgi:hypothetical protein